MIQCALRDFLFCICLPPPSILRQQSAASAAFSRLTGATAFRWSAHALLPIWSLVFYWHGISV